VLEGATEVRIMLCKEKRSGGNTGTSVVAACGAWANLQQGFGHMPQKQQQQQQHACHGH
jgi:hypothetical protein